MEIQDKIKSGAAGEVRLYKEGIFWVAYEQSAWLVSQVKTLKPTKRFVKKLGMDVVSVGFPDSVLETIQLSFDPVERSETLVVLHDRGKADLAPADEVLFETWKAATPCSVGAVKPASTPPGVALSPVLDKIRQFDLANATPMACLNFVFELKKEIA